VIETQELAQQAGPGAPPAVDERLRERIRLLAFCLLLAVLPVVTAPGRIIADTKLDLAVNPAGWLARALTLWDPQQFGQLQDQAAGYLFPMGPFFYLGHLAGLQPWVVQRLWISAVAVAAFLGTVKLAERLGIGSPWSRIAAGLAYAASPAALALLGGLSAEFLPAAMLPWILIPLVTAARGGRPGTAAARSAFAAGCCGGVNAAATIAVLLPAFLYILSLGRPAPRWRLLGWWCPAVLAACSWWAVPLVLLSRYGVSIIPYTESASITTSVTGLSQTLRGTENWVSYLVVDGQPWWLPGYRIVTGTAPILLTGLAAGLGLAGLVHPRMPGRRFLLGVLLTGVLIITAGHLTSLGNPLAGPVDQLINGPASPFRNLRKFDPMIRLPVALGLAHLLASVRLPRLRVAAAWAAGLAIGGLALPAYTGGAALAGPTSQIPSYWVTAANWLNTHAGHQSVLVVPGAPFGQYVWGSPLDDVLEPLMTADWADRNLSTIGSVGNTRLLDAIDQRVAAGDGSAGLTQVLAGMGVRYVVVRDDLSRQVLRGALPGLVNQAMRTSPGITRVAQFGLPVSSLAPDDATTNLDPPYPAVVIYQVAGASPVVSTVPAASAVRVYGGPESLLTLADEGMPGSRPVLLNSDPGGGPAAASVLTDSLRRRVRNFGEIRTSYSPTLTATGPAQTFEATGDYTERGWAKYLSVARYQGIGDITASSSASDIGAIPGQWASGLLPYAAIDGDPRTMWESGSWNGPVGQWLGLRFTSPVDPGTVQAAFADAAVIGPEVTRVTVRTAAGQVSDRVRDTGQPQSLRVPPGRTGWLQITVTGVATPPPFGAQVAIKEITVPGVTASREIVAPTLPASTQPFTSTGPAAVVLAKAQPWSAGCMRIPARWVCSPSLISPTEEQYGFDHAFSAGTGGQATLHGRAVLTTVSLATKFLAAPHSGVRVTASSTYTPGPQDQAIAAFDANPATAWIASSTDAQPVLTIGWRQRRTVRSVTIQRPPGAQGLLQVLISGSAGQVRGASVGAGGTVRFAPMRTTRLRMRFTPLQGPLQISGVRIPGVPQLRAPAGPLRLRCGLGPAVSVDGQAVPTRVTGSFSALLTGQPLRYTACREVTVAAGANQVTESAADHYSVQDAVLARPGDRVLAPAGTAAAGTAAAGTAAGRTQILSWSPSRRVVKVTAGPASYLVVNENYNAGWQAAAGGRVLRAVRLDGWKQAWLLPAGTSGVVTLTYRPDGIYRVSIVGGLVLLGLLGLLALGWWPRRARRARAARVAPAEGAGEQGPGARGRGGLATAVLAAAAAAALLLAGFWLGGYPGAVILPVAAGVFWALASYRSARSSRTGRSGRWLGSWLSGPWLLPGLLLAAAGFGAVGERLLLSGDSSPAVMWLTSGIPQVLCLVIIGRLAVALLRR
jgi:arabinofuranan 3-O-arabinosyltransferase